MDKERVYYLLEQQMNGNLSHSEEQELSHLLESGDKNIILDVLVDHITHEGATPKHVETVVTEASFEKVMKADRITELSIPGQDSVPVSRVHRVHFLRTAWFRYAVAIILLLGAGTYHWFSHRPEINISNHPAPLHQQFGAFGNKAVLTLADGTTIILDSTVTGNLAQQGNTKIIKLNAGALAYKQQGQVLNGAEAYNTITTPRGSQYQIILSDESKVWLNAASSLKYPVSFKNNIRNVELTGEGYFEVKKNRKPFSVKINDVDVEVLGTSFNIMGYADEDVISTTLAEGRVKVTHNNTSVIINEGQQASLPDGNSRFNITTPNLEEVLSWKNGQISFTSAALAVVMRRISRWYDVDVQYEKGIPAGRFNGLIDKDLKLTDVLGVLEIYGIHTRLEGRTIVVTP